MGDGRPVHLLRHVQQVLHHSSEIVVHVGTDSHNRGDQTLYTTTVVLRYRQNGAHVLYHKERTHRVKDMWTRLWGEVERSLVVARALADGGILPLATIDLDLNSVAGFASNKLHKAAVGHVVAMGFEARTKPDILPATWAANILCNGRPLSLAGM